MGAEVPGYPTGAQPHEGSCEKLDSSLHGYLSTANIVPIHDRGASLPPPSKIQNAVSRGVRRNEGPSRPPQHLQEPDGVTWIPKPSVMLSLCNHTEGPNISLVQQTFTILDLVLQRALHRVCLPLHWSSDIQEAELSLANHQVAATEEPEVLHPKVQRKVFKGGRPRREVRHHHFHRRTMSTIKGPNVFHLKESTGDHDRGARQSREVYQRRGSPYIKTGKLFRTQGKKQRQQKEGAKPQETRKHGQIPAKGQRK